MTQTTRPSHPTHVDRDDRPCGTSHHCQDVDSCPWRHQCRDRYRTRSDIPVVPRGRVVPAPVGRPRARTDGTRVEGLPGTRGHDGDGEGSTSFSSEVPLCLRVDPAPFCTCRFTLQKCLRRTSKGPPEVQRLSSPSTLLEDICPSFFLVLAGDFTVEVCLPVGVRLYGRD